jgi:trk system potassium uptake protein TrkH
MTNHLVYQMKRLDHLAMIAHDVGQIFKFLGLVSLVPFIVLAIFREWNLILPMAAVPVTFLLLWRLILLIPKKDFESPLSTTLVAVSISWVMIALVGALPFMLAMHMSYTDSIFEAMAGWTGTAFSMIPSLDDTPNTLLFWRSFMQWIGGIGIIAFGISMRRKTRLSLFRLFRSEGKPEDLMSNAQSTSWRMWKIYIFLTAVFTGLVMLAGIPLWDSVNLVMVGISTGGFTLHSAGISYYHNPLLEILLIPVMIAGALPFKVFFLMYRGKLPDMFHDTIVRLMLFLMLAGSLFISLDLYIFGDISLATAFREGVFCAVSAMSTCGFQNSNLHFWATVPLAILSMMIFIGGAMGSAAGGIKVNRVALAYDGVKWWFRRFFVSSRVMVPFRFEGKRLSKEISELEISRNLLVIALYVITIFSATIVCLHLYITSFHLDQVVFEIVSALSNTGMSVGFMTASSPVVIKWIFIVLMWLGRMEIVPVVILAIGIYKGVESELAKEVSVQSS